MSVLIPTVSRTDSLTIPVDAEHGGIRAVVLLAFIGGWLIGFILTSALIPTEGFNLLAIIAAFGLAALIAVPLERYLKARWPSGRIVTVDDGGVRIEKRGMVERELSAQDPAQPTFWCFEIQKRTRIPKGWSMLACALESEGHYLVTYTFASPDALKTFDRIDQFKKLISRRDTNMQKDMRDDMRLAGEQRRLRDAEAHRWAEGAEMSFEHFQTYLNALYTRFPEWMSLK